LLTLYSAHLWALWLGYTTHFIYAPTVDSFVAFQPTKAWTFSVSCNHKNGVRYISNSK